MRSSDTKTVGLLVPDLRNPYFADLVASMEDELYRHGVSTLIGTSSESVERQDVFIENLLGQRIDGAIVVPQGVKSPGVQSLIQRDLPLVFVDRRVPGVESVPFVVSDPYTGIREALEELVRLGHRHVAICLILRSNRSVLTNERPHFGKLPPMCLLTAMALSQLATPLMNRVPLR